MSLTSRLLLIIITSSLIFPFSGCKKDNNDTEVINLLEILEEHDDVQKVHTNISIDEDE